MSIDEQRVLPDALARSLIDAGAATARASKSGGADDKLGLEALEGLVALIPNDLTLDRDQWVSVGHGLKALCESDDEGFEVFDAWSQTWEGGYDAGKTRKAWDSFGASGLKARGGALKARAAVADPGGFERWTQSQSRGLFADEDAVVAEAAAAAAAAAAGVQFDVDQQKAAREALAHMGGAVRLVDAHDWRGFDPATGLWRKYPGNHALRVVEQMAHERKKGGRLTKGLKGKLGSKAFLSGVAALIAVNGEVIATETDFDQNPLLLGAPSGVIDLTAGASRDLRVGVIGDMVSKRVAVDPAPRGTPHPRWSRFLGEFTQGDAALEEWLQVYCGYALTGLMRAHVAPFFYGHGTNGKSVFINTVGGVFGEYRVQIDHRLLFEKKGGFHLAPLAALAGARLGTATDVAPDATWDTQMLKGLTGGDKVTANFMHGNSFTFDATAKLMLSGNDQPGIKSIDGGMRRRLRMLPMKATVKKVDDQLPEKLQQEWPAILRWALEGLDLYWAHGLPVVKAIEDETRDYMAAQDPFGRWMADCLRADPTSTAKLRVGDLFRSWDAFRSADGQYGAPPRDPSTLSRALGVKGIEVKRDKNGAYIDGYALVLGDTVNPF